MSEPESLATDEGLAARLHRHRFDRMIMLSDGIFAISTTLAALELRLPAKLPDLATVLRQSGRQVLVYFLSFGIIAALWMSNRELFARLKRVDGITTALTLALLCMTALIPAVTRHVRGVPDGNYAAYLLTMAVCGTLNGALWTYSAARPGLMLDGVTKRERWGRSVSSFVLVGVTLPSLLLPQNAALIGMTVSLVALLVIRRRVVPRLFPATEAGSPNH